MTSIENPLVSRLICPTERFEFSKRDSCKKIDDYYIIIDNADDFPYVKDDNSSHFRHQLYSLFWCNNKESKDEFQCGACQCKSNGTNYYFCNECKVVYHKECVESPLLIKSLYHPKHNLQLLIFNRFVDFNRDYTKVDRLNMIMSCCYCGSFLFRLFYYCSLCSFSIHLVCARIPPFLDYKKRHEHILNYFPRKTNLMCDVCGLVDDNKSFIYLCLQCDFIVHKTCIYLPFVIRISRHEHRIIFTYSSSSEKLSCGVCRLNVDESCGKYSCMKDCTYVVHSKCATREDVWDGQELEDEQEEIYENLNSIEFIGDGVIQHFSHPHHMRHEDGSNMSYDENKKCQACVLPLYDGDVYKCMDSTCDFVLHEACANFPRTKQHMAYPYRLALQISDTTNYFNCQLCQRYTCGFKYASNIWEADVRCVAVSEPFDHQCHMHPLFLTTVGIYQICSICRREGSRHLNCLKCDFILCFRCATLPYKVRYEHDQHFLTLSYEENTSLNWCEVCEVEIDSPEWLYTCNECGVTLHIYCFQGKDGSYMKPAQNIKVHNYEKVNIVPNYGFTRPICSFCGIYCQNKMRFETGDGSIFCSEWELAVEVVT